MKKCSSSLVGNAPLLPVCLDKEEDSMVKYRLAFLNSIHLIGHDLEKACQIFRIAIPTAYVWIRQWNEQGRDGLVHPFHYSDRPCGHPSKLTAEELGELKLILLAKDKWLTHEIHDLIVKLWDVDLSRWQISRILKGKFKMHLSKPYPHDYRRPDNAEALLQASLDAAYQKLEAKGFSREEIALGFLDEASPQTTANTVRFWHFGNHLDISKDTTRRKANSIGFYAVQGESVQDFLPDSTQESIAAFLAQVGKANAAYKAIIVVLDNFSSHVALKNHAVTTLAKVELVFLPAYSPDLNPIEFIWKTIKRRVSENFVHSVEYLKGVISSSWKNEHEKMSYAKSWIEQFTPWLVNRALST
jgi:transposase